MKFLTALVFFLAFFSCFLSTEAKKKHKKNRRFHDVPQPSWKIDDDAQFTQLSGVTHQCIDNKAYAVTYDVSIPASSSFTKLDTVSGLRSVSCNVDDTYLEMKFDSATSMASFLKGLVMIDGFLTGDHSYCGDESEALLRRVIKYEITETSTVVVHAVPTKYDEIFQDAEINFGAPDTQETSICEQASKTVCFGANTNKACNAAAGPIPVYSGNGVNVVCTDCFIALKADIFVDIKMTKFTLNSFSTGFRNIAILGDLILQMDAQKAWSTGVDKTLKVVGPTTIFSFWVGPVPIHVWFQVPVRQLMTASFYSTANAQVGARMNWNLGEASVSWTSKSGWTNTGITPKLTYTPVLSARAEFNAASQFALIPSFEAHVDNFFSFAIKATPDLFINANGTAASRTVCANMAYDVRVDLTSDLDINIPWTSIHKNYHYEKVLYTSGRKTIGDKCIKF